MHATLPASEVTVPMPDTATAPGRSVNGVLICAPAEGLNAVTPEPVKSRSLNAEPEPVSAPSVRPDGLIVMRTATPGALEKVPFTTMSRPVYEGNWQEMLVAVIAPASPPAPTLVIRATGGPDGAAVVGVAAGAEVGAADGAVLELPHAPRVTDNAMSPSADAERRAMTLWNAIR